MGNTEVKGDLKANTRLCTSKCSYTHSKNLVEQAEVLETGI